MKKFMSEKARKALAVRLAAEVKRLWKRESDVIEQTRRRIAKLENRYLCAVETFTPGDLVQIDRPCGRRTWGRVHCVEARVRHEWGSKEGLMRWRVHCFCVRKNGRPIGGMKWISEGEAEVTKIVPPKATS